MRQRPPNSACSLLSLPNNCCSVLVKWTILHCFDSTWCGHCSVISQAWEYPLIYDSKNKNYGQCEKCIFMRPTDDFLASNYSQYSLLDKPEVNVCNNGLSKKIWISGDQQTSKRAPSYDRYTTFDQTMQLSQSRPHLKWYLTTIPPIVFSTIVLNAACWKFPNTQPQLAPQKLSSHSSSKT